jgi:uncharacterized protein (UPF0212 family)
MDGGLEKPLFSSFYKLELKITYVDAKGTSSLCPICGEKLSPNGVQANEMLRMRVGGR